MKKLLFVSALAALFAFSQSSFAQCSSAKAVQASYTEVADDVVDIAISSPDHTTLVAAVKAAGLVETLKSEGPFTVFAPTNAAFDKLPEGTIPTLLKPENKGTLTAVLTYHVVAGNLDSKAVVSAIQKSGGTATLTTVQGGELKATIKNGEVYLIDVNGGMSKVTAVDLKGSNGVVHVIDTVVMPK